MRTRRDYRKSKMGEGGGSQLRANVHYRPRTKVIYNQTLRPQLHRYLMVQLMLEASSVFINDCFEKGPNLTELIPTVFNQLRVGK